MSLAQESNKEIAHTLHTALKSKGHTLPLGHVYEALSQLAGFENWNLASAKNVDFSKHLVDEHGAAIAAIESICKIATEKAEAYPASKHYTKKELMKLSEDELIEEFLILQKEEQFLKENSAQRKAAKKLLATLKK